MYPTACVKELPTSSFLSLSLSPTLSLSIRITFALDRHIGRLLSCATALLPQSFLGQVIDIRCTEVRSIFRFDADRVSTNDDDDDHRVVFVPHAMMNVRALSSRETVKCSYRSLC